MAYISEWGRHKLLMNLLTLDGSKSEVFETYFFDSGTTKNDHQMYVKHVLGPIYVFFTCFFLGGIGRVRGGGGVSQEIGTQPADAAFTLDNSKIQVISQRLLDPSPAGLYTRGKHHVPHFGPFWGYSHTLPHGVRWIV